MGGSGCGVPVEHDPIQGTALVRAPRDVEQGLPIRHLQRDVNEGACPEGGDVPTAQVPYTQVRVAIVVNIQPPRQGVAEGCGPPNCWNSLEGGEFNMIRMT